METAKELASVTGVSQACRALGIARASLYRLGQRPEASQSSPKSKPARSLSEAERQEVLDVLHSERFVDQPPAEVYGALLDEGVYLCSVRTMYRILKTEGEVRERRNVAEHPSYAKPELLATRPNELWSWDITKLLGPVKWTYFYLYVILDVFSRYTVGWMIAHRESAALAKRLIEETFRKQEIEPWQLTLHADRGSSMRSKPVALLLSDLGITKTHSRPHVSNDNPFSESQFKTLKYRPEFPKRFGCIQDARQFCLDFFNWYNTEHRHGGIGLLTPQMVHYEQSPQIIAARQQVLDRAYEEHPERFIRKPPQAPRLPQAVWINPPAETSSAETELLPKCQTEVSQCA
ncbi:MAG: IS3 family transposase [Deltaproteobacteria bacterium]|nr:IS3 family transposase [Deltaproteobacteria bacterium]